MAISDLFQRFKKQVETSDHQRDEELRTHYYKTNFNQMFQTIEELFRKDADCRVTTVSKEHGELAVEISKPFPCFLVVTIISARPLETSVDFTVSTERFSLIGSYPILKRRIVTYYERLNKLHTYLGSGKNS
ncbi:hypothetical protein ACF5W4_13735 [Bacillota bacterium Lsc_1132]